MDKSMAEKISITEKIQAIRPPATPPDDAAEDGDRPRDVCTNDHPDPVSKAGYGKGPFEKQSSIARWRWAVGPLAALPP